MILLMRLSIRYNCKTYHIFKNILSKPYCNNGKKCDKNRNENDIIIADPPTNCCMSGCANCVWITYAEDIAQLFEDGGEKAHSIILEKVTDTNMQAFLAMELRNLKAKNCKIDKEKK